MEKFAFIIHPIDAKRDVARKGGVYSVAKYLPESAVEWAIKHKEPIVASHITGLKSLTGAEAEGWFIACPLTPRQLMTLPTEFVIKRLVQCGKLAESLGAKIIGLGAFTSVVGDGGITVAKQLDIAVTTGNSYTVATAVEGTIDGAKRMGISLENAKVAIVGATGSIGRTCAHLLAPRAAEIALIGRDLDRLGAVAAELNGACVTLHNDVHTGLRDAEVVVTVTSAVDAVIQPEDLVPGCVVCDVARPRDVSVRVNRERNDVLVLEGGVVAVPGADLDFRFNFGFPPKTAYACMSETMMLALEGRYESFTLGKDVTVAQVNEISALAKKHGFHLAGYRSFEKKVEDSDIEMRRRNAEERRKKKAA
ncbi:shikimate 5-dehydrogenase [Capsulimonas corticalis]|uniref:Shikimate 5-dehydrogenase n=1 Tax=Capsulimonas corticalis TaxID=2219043 RepID=A0A402D0Z8_9BACT|nr:shikimate dehydrogenase [Capsulimonas corticalis]BDI31724.1 shikimate 5-dehydrogenase [Capsulimonas corticalis]